MGAVEVRVRVRNDDATLQRPRGVPLSACVAHVRLCMYAHELFFFPLSLFPSWQNPEKKKKKGKRERGGDAVRAARPVARFCCVLLLAGVLGGPGWCCFFRWLAVLPGPFFLLGLSGHSALMSGGDGLPSCTYLPADLRKSAAGWTDVQGKTRPQNAPADLPRHAHADRHTDTDTRSRSRRAQWLWSNGNGGPAVEGHGVGVSGVRGNGI